MLVFRKCFPKQAVGEFENLCLGLPFLVFCAVFSGHFWFAGQRFGHE